MRYEYLIDVIDQTKPEVIVEIGTNLGVRAKMMASEALKHRERVRYLGYDLFEEATDETDSREFNAKPRCNRDQVLKDLGLFQKQNDGFEFELTKGDSRYIKRFPESDLAFVDGGHSIETIVHDFNALKGKAGCIVLDDYYTPDENGTVPDTDRVGCNKLVDELIEKDEPAYILPKKDKVAGGGYVQMVAFGFKPLLKKQLVIKTRNAVPDSVIKKNIRASVKRKTPRVAHCKPHGLTAVVVSAGPSWKKHVAELRELAKDPDIRIFCVKHNHDALLSRKIPVWGCILLDPRGHVKGFLGKPRKEVTYLVASQCEPAVFKCLRGHKVSMYHAHVGAGEEALIDLDKEFMIGGGAAAATRGIGLLHTMGFRRFKLFGYDGSFEKKPKDGYKVELPAVNGEDPPQFYTNALRAAESQDVQNIVKAQGGMYMDVVGDGMIAHMFKVLNSRGTRRLSELEDFDAS